MNGHCRLHRQTGLAAPCGALNGCSHNLIEQMAMNEMILIESISCPHCSEIIELVVDLSAGGQQYVEDCAVCCRPIVVRSEVSDGQLVSLCAVMENE
jgi:hypothetical protein